MKCLTCPVRTGLQCLVETNPEEFAIFCEWSQSKDPVLIKTVAGRAEFAAPAPVDNGTIEPVKPELGISDQLFFVYSCDYRTDALNECSCTARKHCGLRNGAFKSEP